MDFPIVVATLKMKVSMHLKQFKPMIMMIKLNGLEKKKRTPAPTLEVKKNANAADVKDEKSKDTASEQTSSGGSIALWIVSIIAIILSLVALFKHSRK